MKSAELPADYSDSVDIKHDSLHLKFSTFMEMFQQILVLVEFNFIVSLNNVLKFISGMQVSKEQYLVQG